MAIYFLRHGESQANAKGLFAGQRDNSPLTPHGLEQAREAATELHLTQIDVVVTSNLRRAFQTAQEVVKAIGLDAKDIKTDERLLEYDMGALAGTPLRKLTPFELSQAEGAEDPYKFQARVLSFLRECQASDKNILIVSHAAVGRIIEASRLGLNPRNFYEVPPYPNAQPVKLDLSWLV